MCHLVDISPGGAGICMSIRKAPRLGAPITLELGSEGDPTPLTPHGGRVVRRVADEGGQCRLGLAFDA
jgi:hypothetical protein